MPNEKPIPKSAVVDASVLVSAFLFPESIPGRVVALAEKGVYALLDRHSKRPFLPRAAAA
jgi:hypothetical protein